MCNVWLFFLANQEEKTENDTTEVKEELTVTER